MPKRDVILNLPGFTVKKVEGYDPVVMEVVYRRKARCVHCNGKERVKVVCMDLSSSYRQIVQHYFPNAKIVADRFHVIRLIHHQCLQTYQEIDPTMKHQRGLLAALRTKPDNLTHKRLQKRDEYLKQQPIIMLFIDLNSVCII